MQLPKIKSKENVDRPIVREATLEDLDRLVELEFETFRDVYDEHPSDEASVRSMIATRMSVIKRLMIVGEIGGSIEGVMACQRTNLSALEVKSWEETTNNGTLLGTHVPNGKNFYVVNLAVSPKGSEQNLSDQLIANMMGKFIEAQAEEAQLLSRIPQFSQWLADQEIFFEGLTPDEQDVLAKKYVTTKKVVGGRERLYDGVLQRYVDVGVKPLTVLRDSYTDPSSKNYEVLCTFDNPLPRPMRNSRATSFLAGRALQTISGYPEILKKFIST